MDPLTASLAFATIVQLIALYKQEHKDEKDLDHQKFIEWLQYHRHEAIIELICKTTAVQAEVDNLLRQDTAAILAKLDSISAMLATFLSRVDGFGGLVSTMMPSAQYSEQALSILRQLVHSNSKEFFRMRQLGGAPTFHLERGGHIKFEDARFIDDDLNKLTAQGLLSLEYNKSGEPIYGITRDAVRLIALIDEKSPSTI